MDTKDHVLFKSKKLRNYIQTREEIKGEVQNYLKTQTIGTRIDKHKKTQLTMKFTEFNYGDRDRIQTCNPHIRSVVLYSVELRSHSFSLESAKIRQFL